MNCNEIHGHPSIPKRNSNYFGYPLTFFSSATGQMHFWLLMKYFKLLGGLLGNVKAPRI